MHLRTEAITKQSSVLPIIKTLYEEAFPANERAPMSILLRKARKPFVDFVVYYEKDTLIGFTYSSLSRGRDLVFVMYLAIDPALRSKGYGSRILEQLRQTYAGSRIILNIEAVEKDSPNAAERLRRRDFYVRNGYTGSGFLMKEFGVWYEALVAGGAVGREEYLRLYSRFMGFPLSLLARPKIVPMPDAPRSIDGSGR